MLKEYMSFSQWKQFISCEAKALAILKGDWIEEPSKSLLQGRFFETALLEADNLDEFIKLNEEELLYKSGKNKGSLKAEFQEALDTANRVSKDNIFHKYIQGEKQVSLEKEIDGVLWKGLIDIVNDEAIIDLKYIRSLEPIWNDEARRKLDFISHYKYGKQLALYQHLYALETGIFLPCYIAVVTKESYADYEVIHLPDELLEEELDFLLKTTPRFIDIKLGKEEARRCNTCDYCRATKKLTAVKDFYAFAGIKKDNEE